MNGKDPKGGFPTPPLNYKTLWKLFVSQCLPCNFISLTDLRRVDFLVCLAFYPLGQECDF